MLNRLFGNYLISRGRLAQTQLDNLLSVSREYTAKPETVVVLDKLLPENEAVSISSQCADGESYTQAALRLGLLSENQLEEIGQLQTSSFMRFMEVLLEQQILTRQDMLPMLAEFQKDSRYTDAQMHSLCIDDLERIADIFVPIHNPHLHELTVTLLRTFRRLIDKDVYLDKAYMAHTIQIDRYAAQMISGDINVKLYLSAPMNNLLAVANYFSEDTYPTINEDALDNVGEFINCVSGLYATNLSYDDVEVDMDAPEYGMEGPYLSSGKLYVIPIHANHFGLRAVFEVPQ